MTNLEALQANISDVNGLVISTNNLLKALIDEGIDSALDYTAASEQSIDQATIRIYNKILGSGNMGDNGISWASGDKVFIEKQVTILCNKWDLPLQSGEYCKAVHPW